MGVIVSVGAGVSLTAVALGAIVGSEVKLAKAVSAARVPNWSFDRVGTAVGASVPSPLQEQTNMTTSIDTIVRINLFIYSNLLC
jgi:hypothetical protein